VVLAHNHPSGDVKPSEDDVELTRRAVEAGELLGISVLDHLVVGAGRYLSMAERGLL
jgi:DNA repair protein RadC